MALSEACAVWIEQRVNEELSDKDKTGKSLRAIGRAIAKEIDVHFDVEVKPETIRKKASRMGGTNVPPKANSQNHKRKTGDSGDKLTPKGVARMVECAVHEKNISKRKAARTVARVTGLEEETVRKSHQRYQRKIGKDRPDPGPGRPEREIVMVSDAMGFATMAISQLERIRDNDPKKDEALHRVIDWAAKKLGMDK